VPPGEENSPTHRDDFDVFKSPVDEFRLEARVDGLQGKVHYLRHDESYRFAVGAGRLAGTR
jgi:hypothetical protein